MIHWREAAWPIRRSEETELVVYPLDHLWKHSSKLASITGSGHLGCLWRTPEARPPGRPPCSGTVLSRGRRGKRSPSGQPPPASAAGPRRVGAARPSSWGRRVRKAVTSEALIAGA